MAESVGTLYLCATPIGNLEDMTPRALRMLREADFIAAEDTRHTRQLMNHFEIHGTLLSYHEHNKEKMGPVLLAHLKEGKNIALVSDAGFPGISDPGELIAQMCIAEGIPVVPGGQCGTDGPGGFRSIEHTFLFWRFSSQKPEESS